MKLMPLAVLLFLPLTGCRSTPTLEVNERLVRQADDLKEWPFNVPEGILRCAGNPKSPGLAAVTFTANGVTYGINGGALSGNAFPSADSVTTRNSIGLFSGNYAKYLGEGLDHCKKLPPSDQPL